MRISVRHSSISASFAALAVLLGPLAPTAFAQPVERVEITGSSIKRIEGESALPVQVITRKELDQSGATNVEQFMQGLGVALQGNNNTVAASNSGAATGGVSGISLRGLGSQRTLVLIDGKRVSAGGTLTDSTTVDVNLIPLAAVERVEVLKDGASAIYGSEAIAGVVNFILRKDYQGKEVGAYGAFTQHDGGRGWGANGLVGLGDMAGKGWNATFTFDFRHEDAIFGAQRGFANSSISVPYFNDTTSGNTFPANLAIAPPPGATTRNPSAPAFTGQPSFISPGCPLPYSIADPFFPQTRCRFDTAPLVTLIPETDVGSLFAGGRFKLAGNHEAYGQLGYTHKESQTVIQPVPISDQFPLPPNHPLFNQAPYFSPAFGVGLSTIVLTNTSPFYPTNLYAGNPDLLVRYRSALTGNRDVTDISDFFRGLAGVRGTVSNWDYDLSLLHVQTQLREHVNSGYPLLSRILPLLNSGQVNFFGPNTPAIQAQADATQFHGDAYKTTTTTDSLGAKASRDLTRLPGGPLGFAVGVEERREGFKLQTPTEIQQGDVSGYGGNFLPVDVSRRVHSAYTEVNMPVVRTVELLAAARYDDYEGTGSKVSPKIGIRWQPIRQALVRASYGKGFRAPSLTELYQPQTIGVTAQGITDQARCPATGSSTDCATQFPILIGGSTNLKPETSTNKSIGILLEPINNVSFGVDYWEVDLQNTIIFGISPQLLLNDSARFGNFVTRAPADTSGPCAATATTPACPGQVLSINQVNSNLGATHVKGFDFTGLWRIPTQRMGAFTFNFTGTYFYKYELQNLDGPNGTPGTFSSINGMVSPVVNGSGGAIPRWRHYLTLDWALNPWNFAAVWQYQSHYKDIAGTNDVANGGTGFACGAAPVPGPGGTDLGGSCADPLGRNIVHEWVSDYSLLHLYATYTGAFTKNLQLTAGIRNVFDRNPPYSNAGGQNFFQAGYDPGYADPRGRTFLLSAKYRF